MRHQNFHSSPTIEIDLCLWSLQITITLTWGFLLVFWNPKLKNCLHSWGLIASHVPMTSNEVWAHSMLMHNQHLHKSPAIAIQLYLWSPKITTNLT